MRSITSIVLLGLTVAACGEATPPVEAPAAKLRVEYYEISKKWPFCQNIVRAVGALQEDPAYKDKFESEIILMSTEKGKASDALYGWEDQMHGLVVLGPDGSVKAVLRGHSWGGLELEIALGKLKETLDPLL